MCLIIIISFDIRYIETFIYIDIEFINKNVHEIYIVLIFINYKNKNSRLFKMSDKKK